METICLNLIEATVTLYPANADGSPQLGSPIWTGAAAENLRGTERWLKKQTTPSGARYPVNHPLVAQYEVNIGRLWVLALTAAGVTDWQAAYSQYVLDVAWVEEETQEWHRKTFYGVTISEHGWEARDVENGLMENQMFEAQYMVATSGGAPLPDVIPAPLPYRVVYQDVNGSVLLYTYDATTGLFTAQAATTGRATIANSPFAIQFAGDTLPVVLAAGNSLVYPYVAAYRSTNTYRQNALQVSNGIYAGSPAAGDLPRLDFYYGEQRVFAVTHSGVFEVDYIEGPCGRPPLGSTPGYGALGGGDALVAVFTRGNVTATQIQVI